MATSRFKIQLVGSIHLAHAPFTDAFDHDPSSVDHTAGGKQGLLLFRHLTSFPGHYLSFFNHQCRNVVLGACLQGIVHQVRGNFLGMPVIH